ncbi:MAG: hypothetical protein UZ09_BCD002001115 [Bacteroidetes bacterium OLB9]|nr:MAG: hypothetical protein UZ09_BCD002001115 [Bacteroidetes bacterium OLB9]
MKHYTRHIAKPIFKKTEALYKMITQKIERNRNEKATKPPRKQ